MTFTPNIEKAIRVAAIAHDGQRRKGEGEPPYISHPYSVAFILSHYTDDEDTIIAGLLHDTLEDTEYRAEDMKRDFGKEVVDIVRGVTEEKERDGKKLPWKERKRGYIETLKKAPEKSLMVSAADKLHNLESIIREKTNRGQLFSISTTISVDEYFWFYDEVVAVLEARLDGDIVKELKVLVVKAKKMFTA